MEIKTRLIELIERACAAERAFLARLSEEERSARGEPDRWAPKDVIAHLADWKERLAQNLAAVARGEPPVRYDDFEERNARGFLEHRDRSWSEVLDRAAEVCRQLVAQVEQRSEAELQGTEFWPGERPLWRRIVGTAYIHSIQVHLCPLYLERGEQACATELQEAAGELLTGLDEGDNWQGLVKYNLACHHALLGEKERAIAGLGEALELNPGLTEWSKQDPDLDSIREEPGYMALYPEQVAGS